jgi:hypothetical protein
MVKKILRRFWPLLVVWGAMQLAVRVAGIVLARRRNTGDEFASVIRRVVVQRGMELRPRSVALRRLEVDAAMAGVEIDLSGIPGKVPGGIDVDVRALMAGVDVWVPEGWTVSWQSSGVGGIGPARKRPVQQAESPDDADVRVQAKLLMAGVGLSGSNT